VRPIEKNKNIEEALQYYMQVMDGMQNSAKLLEKIKTTESGGP